MSRYSTVIIERDSRILFRSFSPVVSALPLFQTQIHQSRLIFHFKLYISPKVSNIAPSMCVMSPFRQEDRSTKVVIVEDVCGKESWSCDDDREQRESTISIYPLTQQPSFLDFFHFREFPFPRISFISNITNMMN